jgi:hypothetical protein
MSCIQEWVPRAGAVLLTLSGAGPEPVGSLIALSNTAGTFLGTEELRLEPGLGVLQLGR